MPTAKAHATARGQVFVVVDAARDVGRATRWIRFEVTSDGGETDEEGTAAKTLVGCSAVFIVLFISCKW